MAQTLSSRCHWRRELSVLLAQSATPATLSPAPCASCWPNRGRSGVMRKTRAARHSLQEGRLQLQWEAAGGGGCCRVGLVPWGLLSWHGAYSLVQALESPPPTSASAGLDCHSSCNDAWADPRPFHDFRLSARAWPPDLTPSLALTAEELKYTDIHNIGAMIAPLHFLEVKLGKRPQPVKSELDKEEEWWKRCQEKNKNMKKEQKECLQQESEWLELMNAELKTQMEELKQEQQQLILMLNWHHPTCIIRTDSVKTPDSEGNLLLEQLEET
ncbi:hypothetical protein QTO34_016703 [Cnephaeus nilssonii]|uniref:Jun dimerization protein 2 n=1 Tax=Cnephaeus nilssonii TaxID=3371016 RepID=A0AA40I2Q6_CNENI|nr:hypothetical protein QTO34_016703 [Eptesicus nilssonii]